METTHDFPNDGARLSGVVRGIRNRWRLKRALRGASIVVAAGFILLAASAFALDALRYGETAVTVVRALALLALTGLAVVFVVLPLLPKRMPADRRVALYLEEHEPSLEAAVVTAVEVRERQATAGEPLANEPAHSAVVRQPLSAALVSVGRYAGLYTFRLFDIAAPMEYVVESNGVRSPVYRIDVADVPYTKKLGLDYHFPAYTGLAPQAVDEGGDIAALKGTQVRVRVTTTVPARGGRLVVERGQHTDTVALTPLPDGTLAGAIRVEAAGFYKVELEAQDGRIFPGSLDYTIDALPDPPPTISFSKPGRDEKALNVDEVYTDVQAEDA